ncbi:MAG: transcriptional regulator [Bradyrhizobiaceae bacterium]|nr:MAG: transcriptional regulator [Bradyrhizobiaceae bacterium]
MDNLKAIDALAALAQPTRLEAFHHLVRSEPGGLAAGEIVDLLDVPQNTLSSHLAVLVNAGLATNRREGRSIIYRADIVRFRELVLFLLKDCCGGRPDVCTPLLKDIKACC